jgi:hypothetical protein
VSRKGWGQKEQSFSNVLCVSGDVMRVAMLGDDARQIGIGNHEGRATVMLAPADWAAAKAKLKALTEFSGSIVLEKRK